MLKNNLSHLWGVSGHGQSGKNTFANFLQIELLAKGIECAQLAFATELKMDVQRDFGLTFESLWGKDKEKPLECFRKTNGDNWTAREVLQEYGNFFRKFDKNWWINKVLGKNIENLIITDVRYRNEAEAIKNNNGVNIKIKRKDKQSIHGESHISETNLDDDYLVDYVINNDGNLDDLKEKAKKLIKKLW